MLLVWRVPELNVLTGEHTLSFLFRFTDLGLEWLFTGMYGSEEGSRRGELWRDLQEVRHRCSHPWVVLHRRELKDPS